MGYITHLLNKILRITFNKVPEVLKKILILFIFINLLLIDSFFLKWHDYCHTESYGIVMTRILIIDDDKLIRWSLKELLSSSSNLIDTAATIEEALSFAEKYSYRLIFSDIEICSQIQSDFLFTIRKFQPETKIIILSALSRQQIKQIFGDFKIDAVLEKPYDGEKIRALVDDFLS